MYEEKYLKYKKKYLELKEYLFLMNGGVAACPKIGFHQHEGECWHDALATMLLFSDGISEIVQELFNVDNQQKLQIHGNQLEQLKILPDTQIPLDLLPINFEIEKIEEKKILITKVILYIRESYERFNNEKKPIPIPISKIATKTTEIKKNPLVRQPSIENSLICVKNMFAIVNHNRNDKSAYDPKNHGGSITHLLGTLSIFSYFLLNKPNIKPNYFLSSKLFSLYLIFSQSKSIELVKMKLLEMQEYLKDTICVYIGTDYQFNKDNRKEDYKENEEKLVNEKIQGHVQCFFKCGGIEKYYDDNGVNVYRNKQKNEDILYIDFSWREYLNLIITEILGKIEKGEVKEDDIPKFYCKFSKMYFKPEYGINYDIKNKSRIGQFIFIKKTIYEQKTFERNLIDNFNIYIIEYNNPSLLLKIDRINYSDKDLNDCINYSISLQNLEIFNILLKKPNIEQIFDMTSNNNTVLHSVIINCINIKPNEIIDKEILTKLLSQTGINKTFNIKGSNLGLIPLTLLISLNSTYKLDLIKQLLAHPQIEECFANQDNTNKDTPLSLAIYEEETKIVDLLLEKTNISISFNKVDIDGSTPLHAILRQLEESEKNDIDEKEEEEKEEKEEKILRCKKIFDSLISHKDINMTFNIKDNKGYYTPFIQALNMISRYKLEILNKLLSIPGIDESLLIPDNNGYIALNHAIENVKDNIGLQSEYKNNLEILKLLLSNQKVKENVNYINPRKNKQTPLHQILKTANETTINDLLSELLKIKEIDKSFILKSDNKTPIELAKLLKPNPINLEKKYIQIQQKQSTTLAAPTAAPAAAAAAPTAAPAPAAAAAGQKIKSKKK